MQQTMHNFDDARGLKASMAILAHDRRARGFTLTELLVVIGIIVLVMAMAVPAFNYITGARSQESAGNIVSAMLSRARNLAVSNARHTGVFFRLDPLTDRTVLFIVERDAGASRDPDPLDRYKGWRYAASGNGNVQYQTTPYQDRAIFMSQDTRDQHDTSTDTSLDDSSPEAVERNRLYTKLYRAKVNTVSDVTIAPNNPVLYGSNLGNFDNNYWGEVTEGDLDLAAGLDSEAQILPAGVGVQLLSDTTGGSPTQADRYVRTGLILFDPQGRLELVDCHVAQDSAMGHILNMAASSNTQMDLRSSPGLVFYDLSLFRSQIDNEGDDFTDVDRSPELLSGGVTSVSRTDAVEDVKEDWLAANANVLMVNRATGALTEVK